MGPTIPNLKGRNPVMRIPSDLPWKSVGNTLGGGGQGQVHLVTNKNEPDGPLYALKELRNTDSLQARTRFRQEIEVVKNLDHPAIIRIFDHSEEGDAFQYYVMEYHEGANSLAQTISSPASNPFHGNTLASLNLFEQLILAIQACENASPAIVHRDINPKNILVLPDNSIRLIDFGICQIEDGTTITLADEDVGTRNFTAPECESGSDTIIGVHSDLYSSAKVLWSTITSQSAFAREQPVFNNRSMNAMFPQNTETWHLAHIFEKTIRQRPEDRLVGSAKILELVHDVRRVVQGGFPPLEDIGAHCPSCGWNKVASFEQGYIVFGNPNPRRIESVRCELCGFCFVRDYNVLVKNVDEVRNLN